jgi:Holliday junction resolvase RusA-like endonuclease
VIIHVHIPGIPRTGGNVHQVVPRTVRGKQLLIPIKSSAAKNFQRVCALAALAVRPPRPLRGPLVAVVEIWLPGAPDHIPAGREGDLDGFLKPLLDGLTQGKIWVDDGQVVTLAIAKRCGPTPGVDVWIGDLDSVKIVVDKDCAMG